MNERLWTKVLCAMCLYGAGILIMETDINFFIRFSIAAVVLTIGNMLLTWIQERAYSEGLERGTSKDGEHGSGC